MPRKKLIYLHNNPYHIVCRTNNKEFFRIPLPELWHLLCLELIKLHKNNGLQIHSVVLMSNHYHLLASTREPFYLSDIMLLLQSKLSRLLNTRTQRINHAFGGRYKASLITTSTYFYHATKYIYQNPLRSGLCKNVMDWPFSNLPFFIHKISESSLWHATQDTYFDERLKVLDKSILLRDFNQLYTIEQYGALKKASKKLIFKVCSNKRMKKLDWL